MREAERIADPDGTAPEPVLSLDEAKAFLRVTHDEEDVEIARIVDDVAAQIEQWTGRALTAQLWELVLDAFPAQIVLPVGPVTEIVEIAYLDADGAEQVVAPEDYRADLASFEARVGPRASWPATAQGMNAVTIRWAAGKGCPPGLMRAVKILLEHRFRVRDADESTPMVERVAVGIMAPYRRFKG